MVTETLRELVAAALTANKGDVPKTKRALHKLFKDKPSIRMHVLEEMITWAIREAVEDIHRHRRLAYWSLSRMTNAIRPDTQAGYDALAVEGYNYPLRNGKPLGDAVRSELEVEECWYFKAARANFVRARWFRLIRQALPDNTTCVRNALTEDRLFEFQRKALERNDIKKADGAAA